MRSHPFRFARPENAYSRSRCTRRNNVNKNSQIDNAANTPTLRDHADDTNHIAMPGLSTGRTQAVEPVYSRAHPRRLSLPLRRHGAAPDPPHAALRHRVGRQGPVLGVLRPPDRAEARRHTTKQTVAGPGWAAAAVRDQGAGGLVCSAADVP